MSYAYLINPQSFPDLGARQGFGIRQWGDFSSLYDEQLKNFFMVMFLISIQAYHMRP